VTNILPRERIERSILLLRGHKVMLDADLAVLYGVSTKRLNEQVRRNRSRFPDDFMFQLTAEEVRSLRSQFATSKQGRGGRRYAPLVFTEQGIAMLSTVLNSERAIQVNIEIMRALSAYAECSLPTKRCRESSLLWKRNTIPSFEWFSRRFGN
jgi:ORF6N domain